MYEISEFETGEIERWMRRVEIRKLWQVGNTLLALEKSLQLSHAFMDYAMQSEDYRFLNAALKLNDRLREELKITKELQEIEDRERDCLEKLKQRWGLER